MRGRILIVGQDVMLRARIARSLSKAGHSLELAASPTDVPRGSQRNIALSVIVTNSRAEASDLAALLRKTSRKPAILVGTGRLGEEAPDAIDPSDEAELLARVNALLVTVEPVEAATVLRFANYVFDSDGQSLATEGGKDIPLTNLEYRLLHEFVRRPGHVLSRDQLLQAVSGREAESFDRSVDMLVVRLRRKIEMDPKKPRLVVAVPGRGYKFTANVTHGLIQVEATNVPADASRPTEHRRQVTVLSAEILPTDGCKLPEEPEDLHLMIVSFREHAASICERFGGKLGQQAARELTIYFGYPGALEDAAERGISAGLTLATPVRGHAQGVVLAARVGIATGLVMVDSRGELIGSVLSDAGSLRGLAEPGEVITASSTRRLAGAQFDYRDVGPLPIIGSSEAAGVAMVLGPAGTGSRFDARRAGAETLPLVGREDELYLLTRRWRQARAGAGRVVLLTGEPGIGKSRLLLALRDAILPDPHSLTCYFCSSRHAATALYPIRAELEQTAQFTRNDDPGLKLAKLADLLKPIGRSDEDMALVAELLSVPVPEAVRRTEEITARQKKVWTIDVLLRQAASRAKGQPLLVLFEDLQWIDPTSLEFLVLLARRIATLPVLIVATARPEFVPPWEGDAHTTTVSVGSLSRNETSELVRDVAGSMPLPERLIGQILDRAGGVPLFAEELTKAVYEISRAGNSVAGFSIPTTLQALLTARLDRLGVAARRVAQVGAAIGREFSHELLHEVMARSGIKLGQELSELLGSGLVFSIGDQPFVVYNFKHALIQDAAYHSLLRADRLRIHNDIVGVLELQGDRAGVEPQVLAHHSTEAGLTEKALTWWLRAGRQAVSFSADAEATSHLRRGLSLLGSVNDNAAKGTWELEFNLALVTPFIATYGYTSAELEAVLNRVLELSSSTAVTRSIFPALYGRLSFEAVAGRVDQALIHAREALGLAKQLSDAEGTAVQRHSVGSLLLFRGCFHDATKILEEALPELQQEQHDRAAFEYGQDHYAVTASYLCWASWVVGRDRQARGYQLSAIARANLLGHMNTLCLVEALAEGIFGALRDDLVVTRQAAVKLLKMAEKHKLPVWLPTGTILLGHALAGTGQTREGLERMEAGAASLRAIGIRFLQPLFASWIATASIQCGRAAEGQDALEYGWSVSDSGEHWTDAELHRLQGEILLSQRRPDPDEVERHLLKALEVAQEQCALAWELRAIKSLARLWNEMGREEAARALLESASGKRSRLAGSGEMTNN
jgi:DNA-binding response OmpR family regulator/predicted ATPase